jgi:hypothetical protein
VNVLLTAPPTFWSAVNVLLTATVPCWNVASIPAALLDVPQLAVGDSEVVAVTSRYPATAFMLPLTPPTRVNDESQDSPLVSDPLWSATPAKATSDALLSVPVVPAPREFTLDAPELVVVGALSTAQVVNPENSASATPHGPELTIAHVTVVSPPAAVFQTIFPAMFPVFTPEFATDQPLGVVMFATEVSPARNATRRFPAVAPTLRVAVWDVDGLL